MSPTFADLGVPERICRALADRGIEQPFAIQAATIADALAGRDVCGRAPTGSGKTLAFGIPLVATTPKAESRRPRSLVLAPTRELADQIADELDTFAGKVQVGVVYGGVGYRPQVQALRRGVDILVACPGRLVDLIDQGAVRLDDVDHVVLDEADRMADMGFLPVVRKLLDQTSPTRQTVLFSATLDGDIAALTRDYQDDPARHEVGPSTPDITAAHHVFWDVQRPDRVALTAEAIQRVWPSIVFCRTRHGADRLTKQLSRQGVEAAAIHGGRSQGQRTRALSAFADGHVQALIATDVAARGIHVDGVASVVHFDPPEDYKAYTHRSGRTARAGESGVVVSLIQPDQVKETRRMQRKIGIDEPVTQPDLDALAARSPVAMPRPVPAGAGASEERGERTQTGDRPDGRTDGGQRRRKPRQRNRGGSNGSAKRKGSGGGSSRGKSSSNGNGKNGQSRGPGQGAGKKSGGNKKRRSNSAARDGSGGPKRQSRHAGGRSNSSSGRDSGGGQRQRAARSSS